MNTAATTTTKIIISLTTPAVEQLRKTVPARKRSALIEDLLQNYFAQKKQEQSWVAVERLRQKYHASTDSIKTTSVEWLRKDRRVH